MTAETVGPFVCQSLESCLTPETWPADLTDGSAGFTVMKASKNGARRERKATSETFPFAGQKWSGDMARAECGRQLGHNSRWHPSTAWAGCGAGAHISTLPGGWGTHLTHLGVYTGTSSSDDSREEAGRATWTAPSPLEWPSACNRVEMNFLFPPLF